MGAVTEVTDSTFDEVVLKSDKPVMVDFWADWCGPCKQVAPIIEELAHTHGDKVTFVKMDTNTNPVTPANNYVLGLPTIQLYVNGELVKAFKGAKSKSVLLGAIEEYLYYLSRQATWLALDRSPAHCLRDHGTRR